MAGHAGLVSVISGCELSEGVRRYRPQNQPDQRWGIELFGGSLGVDCCGRRAAPGGFLRCCPRQLLAPSAALDPAIFSIAEQTEKHENRDRSADGKRIDGNHGSYPSRTSVPIR